MSATKGPWVARPMEARQDGKWGVFDVAHPEKFAVCIVDRSRDGFAPYRKEAEDVARLIAAAPDSVEANKVALDALLTTRAQFGATIVIDGAIRRLEAALAKAGVS